MWPLLTQAVGMIQNTNAKRAREDEIKRQQELARERVYQNLLKSRAAELGADTREIGVYQQLADIDEMGRGGGYDPKIGASEMNLIGSIGSRFANEPEDVTGAVADELARRGWMKGYLPF